MANPVLAAASKLAKKYGWVFHQNAKSKTLSGVTVSGKKYLNKTTGRTLTVWADGFWKMPANSSDPRGMSAPESLEAGFRHGGSTSNPAKPPITRQWKPMLVRTNAQGQVQVTPQAVVKVRARAVQAKNPVGRDSADVHVIKAGQKLDRVAKSLKEEQGRYTGGRKSKRLMMLELAKADAVAALRVAEFHKRYPLN